MYTTQELLDLTKTIAAPLFEGKTYPWEALDGIKDYLGEGAIAVSLVHQYLRTV